MANNIESNFREKVVPTFVKHAESARIFSKNVNTQLLEGKFDAESGETVAFKRDSDYIAVETSDGDLTASSPSPIIVGNATGRVQNYITVLVEYQQIEQALKLNQLDRLLKPAATRLITKLETNFASFMMRNTALLAGIPGTAATTWDHIAEFGAVMEATGVPMDPGMWNTAINPFTQRKLASNQRSLGVNPEVGSSNSMAVITENHAGLRVMTATTQAKYTSSALADRVGAINGTPDATYVTAKDTMTQVLPVDGFNANLEIKAGEQVQVTGVNRLNLSTRDLVIDENGAPIVWTATVTTDVTLDGAGAGNITVTGPAIFESTGAFNTVDAAIADNDVVTILGAASATHQPNLFWHKDAFSIGTVDLPKLSAQENTATTEDGIRIKVTRGSDFIKNKNMVRFDILPAFLAANPFLAGQGFGS